MTHQCKVQCHTMESSTIESLGIEDNGKWLPFIFDMDIVDAAKLSNDEEDGITFGCTTIFTKSGDSYIIDTPYKEFFKKFAEYNAINIMFEDDSEEDDINL